MKMLDDIKTPGRAEGWLKEQLAKAKIMGFRSSRLQKR